jgi:hypothetical protein
MLPSLIIHRTNNEQKEELPWKGSVVLIDAGIEPAIS